MQTVWALTTLARILLRTGRWDRAEGLAAEGVELASAVDQVAARAELELILARIAGARGDAATCAALLERSTAQAARSGNVFGANEARWALGRAALGGDRLDEAVAELGACTSWATSAGVLEVELAAEPDLVEALVRLGRSHEAAAVVDAWVERGAQAATPWAPPLLAACRALLADDGMFEPLFDKALELHRAVEDPYLEARTRLAYGERLRRSGRRVLAREELRSAHAIFATLQCDVWASRASRELRASGERLRSAAASGDELTPQEREIALQVASGKANKEVAASLFLSPKTVEFHLSRVYRKLSVSSRTELAALFAGGAG
jgi:DNA-binding CsgD family transcriptional regulator